MHDTNNIAFLPYPICLFAYFQSFTGYFKLLIKLKLFSISLRRSKLSGVDCIWIPENLSFVLTTELGRNILNNCFLFSFKYSYAGDSDFELSVKGISVGIEDLQVMCPYPFNKLISAT